ncbi:MAG: toast rack family protein [Candidatus Aminicenantaceae bacterium]
MRSVKAMKILLTALLIGGVCACVPVDELKEEMRTIQLGEAESVKVELNLGAGELRLQGGADYLMEAYFNYNVRRWKPEVFYQVSDSRGILKVKQGKSSGIPIGKTRNRWDISLSNDAPLDLEVNFGAGEGKLDFRGIILESLDIDMGAGELKVDLTGERMENLDVTIDGGVGSLKIYLPRNIGVRVDVDKGIGSVDAVGMNKKGSVYTNDAFGESGVSIDVKIDAGIGSIDLRLR